MSVIELLSRDPSSYDNGSGPQSVCRHRDCPLYKAPPCFSRRLEELLSNRTCYGTNNPDWRQFTRYFNINIPVGEQGAVRYWVHGHQNRDQHTIQCILEFAEEKGHSPLVYEFEKLIEAHQHKVPGHVCTSNFADCFTLCAKCKTRHYSEPAISLSPVKIPLRPSKSFPLVPSGEVPICEEEDREEPLPDKRESVLRPRHHAPPNTPPDAQSAPPTPPEEALPEPEEVIHVLAPSLFKNEYPYKLFLGNYWILEPIIVLFLMFQTLSSIVITLCEDGGAYTVFHGGLNIAEFINRVIILLLRVLVRVVAPWIFYRQVCSMSEAEKALDVRRKKKDYSPPPPAPVPYHPHVSLWSIVSHAVIFSIILLYLGAFLTVEGRLRGGHLRIRELFQVEVPLIGMRLFVFFDCLSSFFVLMLVGLVKDCYCIENRLSTKNDKYFDMIRKRWYRIDVFCYTMPLILILFTVISLSYDRPMIPAPDRQLDEGDLEMWCFWMIVLSLLLFFGSSANLTSKIVTVIGNVLALCCAFIFTVFLGVDRATFPPGSIIILIHCHISITTINLLFCLIKAHYRHKKLKSKRFWLGLVFWVVLLVSLFAIVVREVISLAFFVVWT